MVVERKGCLRLMGWEKLSICPWMRIGASEQRPSVAKEKQATRKIYTETH